MISWPLRVRTPTVRPPGQRSPRLPAAHLTAGGLEADEGADVVLVRPSNYGPFDRARAADGIVWAGLSQILLDSLSGNGRMPAEGEALLEWMADHEAEWRTPIDRLPPPAGKA